MWVTGCSSLYYHPTRGAYFVDPSSLKTPPEIIKIATRDGEELEGWYFKSGEDQPKGFILHFHGNAQNVSTHFSYLAGATKLGYDYFVFDYRGFGHSTGRPNPSGLIKDAKAASEWVSGQRSKRGDPPLIYFCQSLGSAVCLQGLAEKTLYNPDVLVVDSGFASYRSVARSVAQSTWILWLFQPLAWLMVDNSEAPQGQLHQVEAGATLVVHGEKDRAIHPKHGRALYEGLPGPKEFWSIPDGQHCDFLFREGGKYRARFFAWLENAI